MEKSCRVNYCFGRCEDSDIRKLNTSEVSDIQKL